MSLLLLLSSGGGGGGLQATGTIDVTGSLALGGGNRLAASGTIAVTGALDIGGGTDALVLAGAINITGTVTLGKAIGLRMDAGTIKITGSLDLPPKGTGRRYLLVNPDGSIIAELDGALPNSVTWALNEPDTWSFTLPASHRKAPLIHAARFLEVQVWRGDQLLTWGPITRVSQGSDGKLQVQGHDRLWYLTRRHAGKADRTNYFQNPSFEDGLAYWGAGFFAPYEPETGRNPAYVLASVSTERAVRGRYSARLEMPSDEWPKYGGRILQTVLWEVDAASKDGDVWTIAAQVYIPSADLRSTEGAGLTLSRFSTTEFTEVIDENGVNRGMFPVTIETATTPITPDFPLDKWTRIEVDLEQPVTGEVEEIAGYITLPRGVIHVEDVSLSVNERLQFFGVDQATIAADLVEHAQDPAFDKSDLRIDTDCPLTGILRDRIYLHSEHPNIARALDDFTRLDDGFDHSIAYTPTTSTYRTSYPAAGRWRPKAALATGRNIASYRWTFDGEAANSTVVTLGQGSGSDREEGFAEDLDAFANGLVLEEVLAASPETPIEALDNLAGEHLAATVNPQILQVTTTPLTSPGATKLLGYIKVGDVVPVTLRHGGLAIEGERFRIVRMSLNGDDTLTCTLNRRDVTA